MKFKSEKKVQTEIIKFIEKQGGYVVKIIRGNSNGIHDLIACIDGLFISCEVKAEHFESDPWKEASEWQKRHYQLVKKAKGISMVVASLEQFKETLIQHKVNLEK